MYNDIMTTRRFCKNVSLGMKVWRSATVNLDHTHTVEHIELECPNHELTDSGPVYRHKKTEAE